MTSPRCPRVAADEVVDQAVDDEDAMSGVRQSLTMHQFPADDRRVEKPLADKGVPIQPAPFAKRISATADSNERSRPKDIRCDTRTDRGRLAVTTS